MEGRLRLALFGTGAAYSAVASPLEAYSHPTRAVIAAPIAVAVAGAIRAGWLGGGPYGSSPSVVSLARRDGPGLAVWAALIALVAGFQVAVFRSNPREVYPTLSSLASEAFAVTPLRAAAIGAWLLLGAYLVGRR